MQNYLFYAACAILLLRIVTFVISIIVTPASKIDPRLSNSIYTSIMFGLLVCAAVGHYLGVWP